MTKSDMHMVSSGWLLINLMAGYGAAKLFGAYAWIYVVFFVMYVYYCSQIGGKK